MMRQLGINLTIKANKKDILAKLRINREAHGKMVVEARAGYVDAATGELRARLEELNSGKIASLDFKLRVPLDYTRVYNTTISQLEAHTGDEVELSTSEFNMLVEDEWEWVRDFIKANASYSGSTRAWSASKGFEVE